MPKVQFVPAGREFEVAEGWTILEAAQACGVEINIPCGGQGRCGRCAVIVADGDGNVRRRSTMRLSAADIAAGYALACQTLVLGDLVVTVPPQEEIARHLVTEKAAVAIQPPAGYDVADQPLQALFLALDPPNLGDQTDDWSRVQAALGRNFDIQGLTADLSLLRDLGRILRAADWEVTAVVETDVWDRPNGPPRLVDLLPGRQTDALHAVAIDIGTTTVSLYLVDLLTGQVVARSADYNAQISRGEDVISRIIYASQKPKGDTSRQGASHVDLPNLDEMQRLVVNTINKLIQHVCRRAGIEATKIYKAVVAGNPTMIHLFLGIPPEQIRLTPYIPAINQTPSLPGGAGSLGLAINPRATVDCLPGVASYVGADITAGVLSSGLHHSETLRLFIDVGTNGEMVLGNADWLICCACSAGPAFEGAGVQHGMRATAGAIEEVWISARTHEPTYRTIGNLPPKGICGSGLISLLAEMFVTGVVDKSGNLVRQDWAGFGNRPSLKPHEGQQDWAGFGDRPSLKPHEGRQDWDGFGNRTSLKPHEGQQDWAGFGNRPSPEPHEGRQDWAGFGDRPSPEPHEGQQDWAGFGNRPSLKPHEGQQDWAGLGDRPNPEPHEGRQDWAGFGDRPNPEPHEGRQDWAGLGDRPNPEPHEGRQDWAGFGDRTSLKPHEGQQDWAGLGDRPSLSSLRPRVRQGEHGDEYVVAWAEETAIGRDIVITKVDIDNLLRTKAAIYAGFSSLAEAVGVELAVVEELLIGGSFGQHINVEKAVEIGLLPDLSTDGSDDSADRWARFHYLGNTSLRGAYYALLDRNLRAEVRDIAGKMTYLELSADNRFYEQFTSALFLPHTDITLFPSVATLLKHDG